VANKKFVTEIETSITYYSSKQNKTEKKKRKQTADL